MDVTPLCRSLLRVVENGKKQQAKLQLCKPIYLAYRDPEERTVNLIRQALVSHECFKGMKSRY